MSSSNYREPLQMTAMPCTAWKELAIDFLGTLSSGDYRIYPCISRTPSLGEDFSEKKFFEQNKNPQALNQYNIFTLFRYFLLTYFQQLLRVHFKIHQILHYRSLQIVYRTHLHLFRQLLDRVLQHSTDHRRRLHR